MKKLLSMILAFALLLSLCPAALAEGNVLPDPSLTEEGAKPVFTRAELEAVANDPDGSYYLAADIDLGGGEWTPIERFSGTLDGRGHTIRGLTIECDPEKGDCFGLFSGLAGKSSGSIVLKTAVVKDLTLAEVSITGCSSGSVGALCGLAYYARIENCCVTGSIDVTTDQRGPAVGGLCGKTGAAELTDCVNEAAVYTDYFGSDYWYSRRSRAGGLAGEGSGTFTRCRNAGAVTGVTAGGILGDGWDGASFSCCVNEGEISAAAGLPETYSYYSSPYAGGIVGYGAGDILGCANYGQIVSVLSVSQGSASGGLGAGGIVGYYSARNEVGIARCANFGAVLAGSLAMNKTAYAGGIAAYCSIDDFHGAARERCVQDCLNAGPVQAAAKSAQSMSACAGGIVGYAFVNGPHTLEILRCCDLGALLAVTLDPGEDVYFRSSHAYAGGVCGLRVGNYPDEVPVRNCFVLTDSIVALAAGFSGENDNSVSQESCEIGGGDGTANVVWKGCGAATMDAQMRVDAGRFPEEELYTERGWDFETVWTMLPSGRPTLLWLTQEADEWRTAAEAAPRTAEVLGYTVRLDGDMFRASSYRYDRELALLASAFSAAAEGEDLDGAEIRTLYRELGFPARNIVLCSAEADYFLRYSFAYKRILTDGEPCILLVVSLCGTQTVLEMLGDALTRPNRNFLGRKAYDMIYEYEEEVIGALNACYEDVLCDELNGKRLKILVTGHSLGGAGANLVAARLTDRLYANWWGNYLERGKKDVYAYTFGAIDSIDAASPVETGFENIHNVYNYYDTFGPHALRDPVEGLIKPAGQNMYGKFGHLHVFTHDYSPNQWDPVLKYYNHAISGYMDAVSGVSMVRPCIRPADVNGDGKTDTADAAALFGLICAGQTAADGESLDLDSDGKVNGRDAILLFRRAAET